MGLRFGEGSLEVLSNAQVAECPTFRLGPGGPAFRNVCELRVLGTMLDRKGSTSSAQIFRAVEASGSWFKYRSLLTNKHIPIGTRVRKLHDTVLTSCLFGAGAWTLSTALRTAVQRLEVLYTTRVLGMFRGQEESWVYFFRRRRATLRRTRIQLETVPLWTRVLQLHYLFAGHLARQISDGAPRLLAQVLGFRAADWWTSVQAASAGRRKLKDLEGLHHQKGRGFVRPYESALCTFLHEGWRGIARDRAVWKASRKGFTKWALAQL